MTNTLHNPQKLSISREEINDLPLRSFDGKVVLVNQVKALPKVFKEIKQHDVVGFDTETRPSFHKGQRYAVSLIQLALPKKVFLLRIKNTNITEDIIECFEDYSTIKTGVGIHDDIKALQKIKRFQPEGFLDLAPVAKRAGFQVESIKKLAGLLLGFRISKSAQTSNWDAEQLNEKQISYAATDAWVCLAVYNKLMGN